nr:Chain B, PCNA-associated factor [Homo sapiens]
VRTKADSVPG